MPHIYIQDQIPPEALLLRPLIRLPLSLHRLPHIRYRYHRNVQIVTAHCVIVMYTLSRLLLLLLM